MHHSIRLPYTKWRKNNVGFEEMYQLNFEIKNMDSNIKNYITHSATEDWKPLVEEGVQTKGIFVKVLRYDKETKRAPTFLLKFEAGAS